MVMFGHFEMGGGVVSPSRAPYTRVEGQMMILLAVSKCVSDFFKFLKLRPNREKKTSDWEDWIHCYVHRFVRYKDRGGSLEELHITMSYC
jgi:hypothetical protein